MKQLTTIFFVLLTALTITAQTNLEKNAFLLIGGSIANFNGASTYTPDISIKGVAENDVLAFSGSFGYRALLVDSRCEKNREQIYLGMGISYKITERALVTAGIRYLIENKYVDNGDGGLKKRWGTSPETYFELTTKPVNWHSATIFLASQPDVYRFGIRGTLDFNFKRIFPKG